MKLSKIKRFMTYLLVAIAIPLLTLIGLFVFTPSNAWFIIIFGNSLIASVIVMIEGYLRGGNSSLEDL